MSNKVFGVAEMLDAEDYDAIIYAIKKRINNRREELDSTEKFVDTMFPPSLGGEGQVRVRVDTLLQLMISLG